MAISLNSTSSNTEQTAVTTYNVAHTIAAGSDKVLVVVVGTQNATNPFPSYVTYAGYVMECVKSAQPGAGTYCIRIYFLANPPEGLANITVNYAAAMSASSLGAVALNGAASVHPHTFTNLVQDLSTPASGTSYTKGFPISSRNSWIVSGMIWLTGSSAQTVIGSQTQVSLTAGTVIDQGVSYQGPVLATGSPNTVSDGWTWTTSDTPRYAGIEIMDKDETRSSVTNNNRKRPAIFTPGRAV